MKSLCLVFIALILTTADLIGQTQHQSFVEQQVEMLSELLMPDSSTNLTIIAHTNCPPQYTNVISNTNLFTLSEQTLLKEVLSKYKNVTTNSGPTGTVLTGLEKTNNCYVAHFSYTNLQAREVIVFGNWPPETKHTLKYGGGYSTLIDESAFWGTLAKFRSNDDNGYDVALGRSDVKGVLTTEWVAQIKQGKVNGLFVDFSNEHCQNLLHCVDGKAVGKWLQWDTYTDNHLLEVKIKSSLDYFKYMTQEIKE